MTRYLYQKVKGNYMSLDMKVIDVHNAALEELMGAMEDYPKFASAHEGYAVLLEEVDELWELVKVKQSKHDYTKMKAEAIQIAAMAMRFAIDVCNKGE